jgi:uncharacterized protein YgbK (DUF1537 family)
MLLGCIADDFTGAGDLANTLAKEGMRTRLYIGAPESGALDCEAGVVALKTRSVSPAEAVATSLAALAPLREAGCRQFFFKYCSTFDSTRDGNIGPVAEALANALQASGVIVCPAFPGTGRTLYQGHLFVGDRLLSESGMEGHPLTPMTDPDIRRWLSAQCRAAPGHVDHRTVRAGSAAISKALLEHAAAGRTLVVVDAIDDEDLRAIGAAAAGATLLTGGSGVALGLPANFRTDRDGDAASPFTAQPGPVALFAGSCSLATRAQIEIYRATHPALPVDVARLLSGSDVLDEATAFLEANRGQMPIIYSSAAPEARQLADADDGAAAAAVERLFASLAATAVFQGYRRLVVAGGETSGAVVTALGVRVLDVGPEIDPGVPALSTTCPDGVGLALALKSGNFGGADFLAKAVSRLERDVG